MVLPLGHIKREGGSRCIARSGGDPVGVLTLPLSGSVGVQVSMDPPLFSVMQLYMACNP